MALIKVNNAPVFDQEQVHKGDLIRAKNNLWDDYRNGVVVSVTQEKLIVLYYAGFGNVSNHFTILASEVSRGEWCGSITADLVTISSIEQDSGGGVEA